MLSVNSLTPDTLRLFVFMFIQMSFIRDTRLTTLQILFCSPISEMSIHYYWWSRYYHLICRHFAYFILVLSPSAPRRQDPLSIIHLIGVISMPSSSYLCQWVLDSLSSKISLVILLKHLCYCRRTQVLSGGLVMMGLWKTLVLWKNWVEIHW